MNYEKGYYSNGIVQKELLALLPVNPHSLLDIGCGSGKVSHLVYQQIWCPEVAQLMAEFFSEKYPSLNGEFRLPCMHLESDLAYQHMFESRGH